MRVRAVAVGQLEAVVEQRPVLGADRGDAEHRRVDVHPDPLAQAELADRAHGIDRLGGGRADRCAAEERRQAGRAIGRNELGERSEVEREGVVDRNEAQALCAQAGDPEGLLDGRVRLRRGVAHELTASGPLTRRDHGAEHRGGGRVLDHAAARACRAEPLGQVEQLDEPVEHVRLELGHGRARRPEHPLHAEAGREQLAEHRWARAVRREIAEESRRLPVEQAGHDHAVEVCEHVGERLAVLGRVLGQLRAHPAGLDARADGQLLEPFQVICDPVDRLAPVAAELLGCHVHGR